MCGEPDKVEETEEQRALAQVAAEKWNVAQETLGPMMDEYMSRVDDMDSQGHYDYVAGKANLAQQNAWDEAGDKALGLQVKSGINPNSGRAVGLMSSMATGEGKSSGKGMGSAQFEQQTQHLAGLDNINSIGMGQAGSAQAGLTQIADLSQKEAISDAYNDYNKSAANVQAIGTAAGGFARYGLQDAKLTPVPESQYQNNYSAANTDGWDTQNQYVS